MQYRSFLASWQIGLNARKLHPADKTISYNAAMTGLFLLSSWTGDVLSQTAWKVIEKGKKGDSLVLFLFFLISFVSMLVQTTLFKEKILQITKESSDTITTSLS